jgi:pyruvate dehydrogenase E1 component alpha subunit
MGMRGEEVDGNDVLAVYQVAHEMIEAARNGEGPATLVCHTIRYGGHHVGEPGTGYRSKEEMDAWKARDALQRFEKYLLDQKVLAPGEIESLHDQVEERIHNAVESSRQAPYPDVSEVTDHVYA